MDFSNIKIKSDILLFCQAPKDLSYCLKLHEMLSENRKISIIVINVKNIFDFIVENYSNLFHDIKFISTPIYFSYYKFGLVLNAKTYVRKKLTELTDINNYSVFYFSKDFDWLTAYFVLHLSKNNLVFRLMVDDITSLSSKKIYNHYTTLSVFYLYVITKIKFYYVKTDYGYILSYNLNNKGVQEIPASFNKPVNKNFLINLSIEENSVMIFENNQNGCLYMSNYKEKLTEIILTLKTRYSIYIKPHPRLGYSPFLNNIEGINFLSSQVPSELLNIDKFKFIIGIDTTAICEYARIGNENVFCLLNLFLIDDMQIFNYTIKHINKLSNNKVKYVSSINQLCVMLRETTVLITNI